MALAIAICYGIKLFITIGYNKEALEIDIYNYIPQDAKCVVIFNRDYFIDEYLKIDSSNEHLIHIVRNNITYPLILVKDSLKENLLLSRTTTEQEDNIRKILGQQIAPYYQPQIRKESGFDLHFYSLPQDSFIVTAVNNGIFAISLDYPQIEQLTRIRASNISRKGESEKSIYVNKICSDSPMGIFINTDSLFLALTYILTDNLSYLEGKYFNKFDTDSIKYNNDKINRIFAVSNLQSDSIFWGEDNDIKIFINKVY